MARGADAERLLERLLADPAFRAHFRRDPAAAARAAGLAGDPAGGDPLETLEVRQSRSSLAGVMMAVAVEGVALSQLDVADAMAAPGDQAPATPPPDPPEPAPAGQEAIERLAHDERVTFDADGLADLRAGRLDPRIVAVLDRISREHRVTISAARSDHGRLTAGGSVSNHFHGRAVDIATVDGQPVDAGNAAARRLAEALAQLDPSIRPSEIGSPWALAGPAYFTDADHQDHVHVAFDDPPPADWQPPADQDADADDDAPVAEPAADDDDAGTEPEDDGGDEDADEDDPEDEEDEEDEDEEDEVGPDLDDLTDPDPEERAAARAALRGEAPGRIAPEPDDPPEPTAPPPDTPADPGAPIAEYPGDDASQEELAGWMAAEAHRRGVPPELPVMAALVESGLQNLSGGDRDSVGFFQMRLGIWNQGDYAGYPERPDLQLDWFLDQALAVKEQRIARGLPVDDPRAYGEWVADVERPAEEYRGRYALRLQEAGELLDRAAASEDAAPPSGSADQVLRLRTITPEEARRALEGG